MPERLQKVLAAAGVASRRDAEELIAAGKVTVNGKVVKETGCKVDPERDHITVDGKAIPKDVEKLYIALNKPAGWVTTREDPKAENIVMQLVVPPLEARFGRGNAAVRGLHPVGRLDTQTEGLLLLTNDGAFTQALTHPKHGVPKVYRAEVKGLPDDEALEKLRTGVPLFGRRTLPARVWVRRVDRKRGVSSIDVELREGRNQQVRRMLQAVGFPVTRLQRVSVGPVKLDRLRSKHWRFLSEAEVKALMDAASGAIRTEAPVARPRRPRFAPTGKPPRRAPAATRGRPEGPPAPRSNSRATDDGGGTRARSTSPRPPRKPSTDAPRRKPRDR
jgi:23S rRNA pseudouridine2605 synthase